MDGDALSMCCRIVSSWANCWVNSRVTCCVIESAGVLRAGMAAVLTSAGTGAGWRSVQASETARRSPRA